MPVEQINRFLPPVCIGDIAIASREISGAIRYDEPSYRHLTGRVFNFLIRSLVLPGLQDTQCGFKCFSAAVAEDIFRLQTLTGWSFDVELLTIARRRGYSIVEIGIPWYYNPASKINVLRDSSRMFTDLLTIRRNASKGVYDPQ
jgi:dolichyl-phosphate beta-glucosyltransferase